jgi:hypothetical protein
MAGKTVGKTSEAGVDEAGDWIRAEVEAGDWIRAMADDSIGHVLLVFLESDPSKEDA